MTELAVRLLLLLAWGAVVSLDERAFGTFVFHQPLVAGSIAGALLGNLTGGMTAGLIFQSFWPGLLPIGGDVLPAVGPASVLAGAVTGWGTHLVGTQALWSADGPLLFGVVLGLFAAWAGQAWERGTRARNERREQEALASSLPLDEALNRALRWAYLDTALRGAVVVAGGVVIAAVVYLWPAAVRRMGGAPWTQVGVALPLSALGLGLGGLVVLFQGTKPRHGRELLWGLLAGVVFQLLRGL